MSNAKLTSPLVSIQWLAENLDADNLVILDASMKPVTSVGNEMPTDDTSCIKGARRFDFDNEIRDKNTDLPHMMPSPEVFTEEAQKLGINQDSAVVVYDYVGVYSSPRAWWMFRAMGHEQVAVLMADYPHGKKPLCHLTPNQNMWQNNEVTLLLIHRMDYFVMQTMCLT